jgi:acyl-CoA oxidase
MTLIRPHAVKLVDSWMIPDYLLDRYAAIPTPSTHIHIFLYTQMLTPSSALGRYDGQVYEDLFHRAHRLNPLNKITFNPNYWEDEIVKGSGEGWSSILAKL